MDVDPGAQGAARARRDSGRVYQPQGAANDAVSGAAEGGDGAAGDAGGSTGIPRRWGGAASSIDSSSYPARGGPCDADPSHIAPQHFWIFSRYVISRSSPLHIESK